MRYILLILLFGDQPNTTAVDFNSQKQCEEAAAQITEQARDVGKVNLVALCFDRGSDY